MSEDRVKLTSDRHGFLTGTPIDADQAARALVGIKSDTRKILAIMGGLRGSARAAGGLSPMPRVTGGSMPSVSGASGAASMPRVARDPVTGRFVASPATVSLSRGASAQEATRAVVAAETMARVVQAQQRDQKQERLKNGRFGSGGGSGPDGGGGRGGDSRFSGLGASAGQAVQGTENIDPLLASIGEVKGIADNITGVFATARQMVFGKFKDREERDAQRAAKQTAKDGAKQVKLLTRLVRAVDGRAAGAIAASPGLASLFPGAMGSLLPGAGAAAGAAAAAAAAAKAAGKIPPGVGAGLKRLPVIGVLVEAVTAAFEDKRIRDDGAISDSEKQQARAENAGGAGGAIAGSLAGAAALSFLGPVGSIVGAIGGGVLGSNAGKAATGWVSKRFESGRGGAGTISTGKGDHGGKSYGASQLSSKMGTLQSFLASSPYGAQFAGLEPGSPEFDAKWKALAASDPGFGAAQDKFIAGTHTGPAMARLKRSGMDMSGRSSAVQESIHSTAVQFGPGNSIFQKALAGKNVAGMSDADILAAVQDYKIANNETLFKSSGSNMRAGTLKRAHEEKALYMSMLRVPPALAAMQPPGQMPQIDLGNAGRISSGSQDAPATPSHPPAGRDIPDRGMAHIFSGGIGSSMTHR